MTTYDFWLTVYINIEVATPARHDLIFVKQFQPFWTYIIVHVHVWASIFEHGLPV